MKVPDSELYGGLNEGLDTWWTQADGRDYCFDDSLLLGTSQHP